MTPIQLLEKLESQDKKMKPLVGYCSSFPIILTIAAHVKTCKELDLTVPDSLSYYGLDDREIIANITPYRIMKTVVKQGLFREKITPVAHKNKL